MSSHLSTIKILEILTKIQSYYPVDPDLLQNIKKWIQNRQNPDGSFTPLPADKEVDYYPVEMKKSNSSEKDVNVNEYYYYDKDGNMTQEEIDWERKVEVTAETLVALLEVGVENQVNELSYFDRLQYDFAEKKTRIRHKRVCIAAFAILSWLYRCSNATSSRLCRYKCAAKHRSMSKLEGIFSTF